uniref:pyruvate dehydrogenase (acetyl-transferring) n=1 Tax=Strombidium rassoulzadegani TaxID=1082188 RepID=A0A7S3FXU9_9SPIT|mmetsp:Transcript_18039/g.30744  ORF Transcript_18039/g.30744 Transcript_18039/m.30744 type:complete len:383 (+) Transcript_18039:105-1253(+)
MVLNGSRAFSNTVTYDFKDLIIDPLVKGHPIYSTHRLDESSLPTKATTSKEELMGYFRNMTVMRRTELEADRMYKAKLIRGFCHLYDGQESIAEGMEAGLTWDDAIITAYRDHCQALGRGDTPYRVLAEMCQKRTGSSGGKGGSMHYYNAKNNFYGGNGIVGAQIPVGVGLAFGLKYKEQKNIAVTMYGDGAANQGQLFEAANMAALWKLPIVFLCENNLYGMGTPNAMAAANTDYYTRGDKIPGFKCDAQNILIVRETMKWTKKFCIDNGPLFIEYLTYRYHGHSMSDPGITYRTREEIKHVRDYRDPIGLVKHMLIENSWATEKELKDIEKEIRASIDKDVEKLMKDPEPTPEDLYAHVGTKKHYIRGVTHDLTSHSYDV